MRERCFVLAPPEAMFHRITHLIIAAMFALPCTAQVIETFSYTDSEAAGHSWRAGPDSPAVTLNEAGGIAFDVPFREEKDRYYWDRDGSFDLSQATGFELDIECAQPQAMRSLSLYFRSGDGWYIWNRPLASAGRQKISMQKAEFKTEGTPAGWDNIDKIRLSPWRGQPINATVIVHGLKGIRDRLFVIQAGASAPGSERSAARRAADRMSRWLKSVGISHAVIGEDDLARVADTASVLVFPYNPQIPANSTQAIEHFVDRGGKMIVCYSSSDFLARTMGIRIGEVTNTRDIARWRGIAFEPGALAGVPETVRQQSWSIGLAKPANDEGRVIAWWVDAEGRKSSDPAVIGTPHGYWFTHILLDDDDLAKERMLTALLGSLDETVWREAADHMLLDAGKIDGWAGTEDAIAALDALAVNNANGDTISAFARRIGIHQRRMNAYHTTGHYREAVETGFALNDLLIKTYGLAQAPVKNEFRAVWDHDATGWFPGNWERTAKLLAESGVNAIFINATWAGLAHYPSHVLPQSFTYRYYGDQLEQCIEAAKKYGIEVHAWIVCWYLENSPTEFTDPLKGTDRLQETSGGTQRLWMNPAHPANRQHHLDIIAEILKNYDVDGIHLDYIRYPDSDSCYSPFTRKQFETDTGVATGEWPRDAMPGGAHRQAFVEWRAGVVSSFVRDAKQLINQAKPGVRLSAAVWGLYPQIIQSIGQDWGAWVKDGTLDFVCPMDYAEDLNTFTGLVDQQLRLPGIRGRIYPGIGVTSSESQLRADEVIEQIVALRHRGVGGFAVFDLSETLKTDILPALRMGIMRP